MLWKKRLRLVIDISMTVSMPVLMAYELAGAALHEYLGITVFMLFAAHHVLNLRWFRNIAKGSYSAVRVVNSAVNFMLLLIMFLLPVSGIMMSKHTFTFWRFDTGIDFARKAHLLASYWGFLLMSLHIGLHGNVMLNAVKKKKTKRVGGKIKRILPHIAAMAVMGYGVYAFFQRGINDYLFLKNQFVFFDFSEPLYLFVIDYFAIMVMVACVGYYFLLMLRKLPHKISQSHTERKFETE